MFRYCDAETMDDVATTLTVLLSPGRVATASRVFQRNRYLYQTIKRTLNSSQTATALRPFYFSVHPDLFGRFPKERSVNEESLKLLHEYVTSIQAQRSLTLQPTELVFYLRQVNTQNNTTDLRSVKISLKSHDLRKTVSAILSACNLSLDYVNSIKEYTSTGPTRSTSHPQWNESYFGPKPKPSPKRTLKRWLQENHTRIQSYAESSRHTHIEVDKLSAKILSDIGVASVRWENVWGHRHFITCLRTFIGLSSGQKDRMRKTMEGRHLVFGNQTGVNIHGHIVLASEDVPEEWIRLLDSVRAYDPVIERIPWMEKELSYLLNRISVVRTPQQKFLMAQDYEVLLNKMLNTVRRCQGLVRQQLGDQDLSHLVMVAEGVSSPLALTNCGHIIFPCSIPGSILVKFIVENKETAATFLIDAKMHTFYMDQILHQCYDRLSVSTLTRDDAITPQQMAECCQRLLDNSFLVNQWLQGIKLKVSTYYTVMSDGEVTIPWDWMEDDT